MATKAPARTCRGRSERTHAPFRSAHGSGNRRAAGPPGYSLAASFSHVLSSVLPLTANHLAPCSKRRRKSFARGKGRPVRGPPLLPLGGCTHKGKTKKQGLKTMKAHTYRFNFACPSRNREPSPLGAPRCTPGYVWRPSVCCRACREKHLSRFPGSHLRGIPFMSP